MSTKDIELLLVDAFTQEPFLGNPAGVVLDAAGLDDSQMQKIASEVQASETAFVIGEQQGGFRLRYFTPKAEIAFCGHASVATMSALATAGRIQVGDKPAKVLLSAPGGEFNVELRQNPAGQVQVVITTGKPEFAPFRYSLDLLAGALGTSRYNIPDSWPLGLSSAAGWTLVVPVTTREALDAARPDFEALAKLNEKIKVSCTFLYTWQGPTDMYCRCFAPAVGVAEDPVTGVGMTAAAALIVRESAIALTPPVTRMTGEQGTHMGRKGTVSLEVVHGDNGVVKVRLGGTAVEVMRGRMRVPA
jgi:PhzF family phenazine biosynthesis protein